MSETVKQYAARRGVNRRSVINWIRRGFLIAARKGYGPTSAWLITDTRLPDDAITHQAVQQAQATSASMRAYLKRQAEAGQPVKVEEVLRSRGEAASQINASPQPAPADSSAAAPPGDLRYDDSPEFNQEPPAVTISVLEHHTMSTEEIDAWVERQLARKNVHR